MSCHRRRLPFCSVAAWTTIAGQVEGRIPAKMDYCRGVPVEGAREEPLPTRNNAFRGAALSHSLTAVWGSNPPCSRANSKPVLVAHPGICVYVTFRNDDQTPADRAQS